MPAGRIFTLVLIRTSLSLPPFLSSHSAREALSLVDVVQFPFSSFANTTRATISLVTRSFLRARQVIFCCRLARSLPFPFSFSLSLSISLARSHFFFSFVHRAEIAGALALPQLIFQRMETRLSIGDDENVPFTARTSSILQAKLNLYYSEILSPVRWENLSRARKIYARRCSAPMSSVSHLHDRAC